MQIAPNTVGLDYLEQWTAYRIRAFGQDLEKLEARSRKLLQSRIPRARAISEKLDACCSRPIVYSTDNKTRFFLSEGRCKSRICPRCSKIRARQLSVRIATLVRTMDSPRFLTISCRSNSESLSAQVTYLRRRFAALRRTEAWQWFVTGGVYTIEITFNQVTQQWHPHIHAIIDGKYWQHAELLVVWERIVKDHGSVHIKAVHGVRKLANYIAAYVTKSCDLDSMNLDQVAEWAIETHGLRLAQTFGDCHKINYNRFQPEKTSCLNLLVHVNDLVYSASWGDPHAAIVLECLLSPGEMSVKQLDALIAKYENPDRDARRLKKQRTRSDPCFVYS